MECKKKFEIDTGFFFEELLNWQRWVKEILKVSQRNLDIARTKPPSAVHRECLYMATDGTIWTKYGETWYQLERSFDSPYAEYKEIPRFTTLREEVGDGSVQSVEGVDGTRLDFVKRSDDVMHEDWCWEIRNPDSRRQSTPTAQYYEASVLRCQRSLQLAKVLLEKREQIETWMKEYAGSQGDLRASDRSMLDHDWSSMIEKFAPGLKNVDIFDVGSLLCSLHAVLDQIAVGRQVRHYMY